EAAPVDARRVDGDEGRIGTRDLREPLDHASADRHAHQRQRLVVASVVASAEDRRGAKNEGLTQTAPEEPGRAALEHVERERVHALDPLPVEALRVDRNAQAVRLPGSDGLERT